MAHTPGGRPIALKAVGEEFAGDPEFRLRFAQEVAVAERIHGLFTAQVVASGVDAPTPWLATAYVPGPSLHEAVRRHGPLPVRTVLPLLAGIAEALEAIHRAGVVHRDLKPANVLLAEDGPRVIDFGIARAAEAVALTGTGLRIGTAAFMAPEQALGGPVSPATDVFALGALIAYVASGEPPFGAGPESAALYRVVHEEPDLARVPEDLRGLAAWCLAKRPEDRPAPADLIAAVHAHRLVGARPEYGEGRLPWSIGSEVAGRVEGQAEGLAEGWTVGPEPAWSAPGRRPAPVHAQPTVMAAAAPGATPPAQPDATVRDGAGPPPRPLRAEASGGDGGAESCGRCRRARSPGRSAAGCTFSVRRPAPTPPPPTPGSGRRSPSPPRTTATSSICGPGRSSPRTPPAGTWRATGRSSSCPRTATPSSPRGSTWAPTPACGASTRNP
ncbi:serine/threonine-protein kinase [Streptomyces sp. NPDC085466]|uniref:serine/threonine-protein kinase n=1 Tax=Streptomyces sp. NPDC085466 TaxID=3365725 RepID=UPI0037D84C41